MKKNSFEYFCSYCIYFLFNIPSENIQQAGHCQCARVAETAVVLECPNSSWSLPCNLQTRVNLDDSSSTACHSNVQSTTWQVQVGTCWIVISFAKWILILPNLVGRTMALLSSMCMQLCQHVPACTHSWAISTSSFFHHMVIFHLVSGLYWRKKKHGWYINNETVQNASHKFVHVC